MSLAWIDDLLGFWLDELQPPQWFGKDERLDEQMRVRFLAVYEAVAATFELEPALASWRAGLAHAVLLDQLPRNMFRGTPRAFESDAKALEVAKAAVGRGLDREVPPLARQFLYLPLEHSEALADQVRSVELFTALGDAEALRYALAHHAIIARFGRFPHRNAVLGRPSSAQEIEFLKTPMSSF